MMDDMKFEKGTEYEIFIGIKDKDRYEEILDIEDFKNIVSEICTEKEVAFSLLTQIGGYSHNKGYTTETSFRVVILGLDEKEIALLAEKLKQRVNTDTILITKMDVDYCFI